MAARRESRRRVGRAGAFAAILAAAVIVRVVFLVQIHTSETGTVPSVDARFYDELARSLASGASLPPGALTFNPLYPFFLSAVYRVFGAGDLAPRAAQAVIGVLTIVLVYLGALRLAAGPRAGKPPAAATAAIAAAIALLYAPLLVYEGMLLGTSLEVFLFAAAVLLALVVDQAHDGIEVTPVNGFADIEQTARDQHAMDLAQCLIHGRNRDMVERLEHDDEVVAGVRIRDRLGAAIAKADLRQIRDREVARMLDAIDLGRRDAGRAEAGGQRTGHVGGAATQLEDTAVAYLDQVADEIDLLATTVGIRIVDLHDVQ
jgi:hypothetical protein